MECNITDFERTARLAIVHWKNGDTTWYELKKGETAMEVYKEKLNEINRINTLYVGSSTLVRTYPN